MRIFTLLALFNLGVVADATTHSCNILLAASVRPRASVPRIDVGALEKLTEKQLREGVVVSRGGDDELLAFAAQPEQLNAARFVSGLIEAPEFEGARAWAAEVALRHGAYANFGDQPENLGAALAQPTVREGIRDAYFARVFRTGDRRVMVASLRMPSEVPQTRPAPARAIPATSPLERRPPADSWFALAPVNGHPRYIFWEVPGQPAPIRASSRAVMSAKATTRAFDKSLIPVADTQRELTGGDTVFVPYFSLQFLNTSNDPGAMLFEIKFEERPGYQAVRVLRQFNARPADVVIRAAEFTRLFLEPARVLKAEHLEVRLPATVWRTEIDLSVSEALIESAVSSALENNPSLVTELRRMPALGRVTYVKALPPKRAGRGRAIDGTPFSLVFGKSADGRIYLLAWIRSNQI